MKNRPSEHIRSPGLLSTTGKVFWGFVRQENPFNVLNNEENDNVGKNQSLCGKLFRRKRRRKISEKLIFGSVRPFRFTTPTVSRGVRSRRRNPRKRSAPESREVGIGRWFGG